ncbi:hypothetical protein GGI12_004179, partial [Dipsacomyces acuminosporus]
VSTPSADGKHRDEMISQTLATLEGAHVAAASAAVTAPSSASGSHRSKGHRKNRQNRDRQQQSSSQSSPASTPKSGSGKTSQAAVTFPDNPQPNARLSTIEEVETKSSSNVDGARRQANPAQGSSPGSVISDIPDSVNPSSGGKPSPPGKASPPYSIGSRPKSQNMGRHGSSPLNPYHTGDISSYVGPGISQIPEQPAGKQPGLIQKITGTIRRKRADAPPAADEPDRAGAQTPLPRRWWRNIRESIIHPQPQPEPQVPADAAPNADPTSPLVTDQLSGRPSRRHSFNGSTMLEQEKITAALSPRENLRRKLTVIDRFRGAIRGWRGQSLAAAATAATTGAASGTSAAVGANTGSVKSGVGEFKVAGSPGNHKLALAHTPAPSPIPHKPVLNPLNPFYGLVDQQQQQQTAEAIEDSGAVSPGNKGPKRRASIDVLSVHEMAEVDHAELQNRLQNLVSPGVSEALSGPAPIWDENRPGFSFHAPSPPPPPAATAGSGAKPLPPTPHGSKPSGGRQQIPSTLFTFPAGHSRSETAQSSVFHLSGTHIQQVPPAAQPDANKATSAVSSGSGQKGRPLPQPPTGHVAEPAVDVLQSQSVITGIQSQVQQAPAANVPPPSVLKPQTEKVQFVNQDGSIQVQTAQVAQTPVPPSADDVKPRKKSFFKRLTAGWRNPSPVLQDVELQPQQQQQHSGTYQGSLAPTQQQQQQGPLSGSTQVPPMQPHHSSMQSNIAQGAVQGIAGAVATTATSNMAGKIMGAVSSQSNAAGSLPKTEAVPDVNVVSSASQSQQVHTPVLQQQQQQQQGMGSMVPPTAVGSGSGPQMLQQPLDHSQMSQQPPVQPYATMSTNPNSYSEYNPNFDSLQQSYVLQQNQQQQQQVAGAGPGGQIPGNSPPTAHTSPQSETPVGTPESGHLPEEPKTSKLMSVVQGIPLIGPLFGKKKKQEPKPKTEAPRPSSVNSAITHQTQHHSQYHSQASSVYIGQPEPEESTNPYMKMIEAAGDKIHFIFPAFVYFTRRMAIGEIMPLVGRYAVRYPLVEAEEQAVANAVARIEQDVVKSGAERALRAPEFKFAAPALRYNSLDQRLENAMVPRFSKPRKFRRAPEVWDDPEAQQIADRVYGRLRDFRRDLHQEQTRVARALSRGGADNASRPGARAPGSPTDPLPNMRDVENGIRSRGVDGHQGSGDRVLVGGGGGGRDEGGIAGRIGGFFGGLMGKSKDEPVPPQPSASYHTRSRGNSLRFDSRLSPRAQGFSLSTDMDKQHSLDGSLPRSNGESEARHSRDIADENLADGGERRGIYQRLFGGWMKPKSEEEEEDDAPSPLNIYGRIFGQMPKRRRMHILYAILTTLYLPVVKICMDAIVWNQGFWPVSNPFRTTDKPIFPRPQDGFRDPGRFCYTTTMKNGRFNGAYLILPLAIATLLGLGFWLPLQLHQLSKVHMPRVYGWDHGKGPGNSVPNEEQDKKSQQAAPMPPVTVGDDDDEDGNDEHRQLRSLNGSQQQRGALAATRAGPGSDVIARDDPNPLLEGLSGLAGGFAGVNPETIGYLGTLLNFANGNGLGDSQQQWGMLEGLFGKFTSMLKNNNEEDDPDLYAGLEKEEAYQKRLSRMKEKHRNRHLATVKYRRALDTDTSDFRFIYAPNYPGHASCGARELLWKFAAVFVAVVLDKDNCWSKQHSRHSLDAGRNAVLLIIALLMLRSHHSHRPFFDPTANLSALFSRIGIVVVVIFAFPLFLMHDPLSSSHTGAAMTLALINFCLLLLMLWLASSSLPKIQVALKGPSASLTLSPGILVATSPYDPRLRRLLIERVWQDTWSAILLASRDFRLLPNHRVAFCKTRAHPPYMVNYIGFAAERHLENMYLYDQIGRQAYCRAVELERNNRQRFDMTIEILRFYIGPDMYFNPYATGEAPGRVQSRFGVGLNDVKSWFGKVYVLHFPFMVCMIYDDLPNVIVPIAEEHDLFTYLQQNNDEATRRKREVRRGLRSLNGQYVTLTYIEGGGSNGSHLRYNVNPNTEDHEHFLRRYAGYRRILYRGKVHIKHHSEQMWNGLFNVNPGFGCSLEITDEMVVDDESLVNDFSREQNPFRMAFWRTGRAGSAYRTNVTQRSKANLRMNATNAHLLGVTHDFDYNPDINALFAENIDIIDARRTAITDAIELYQREYRKEFERKRTGLSPAFHIDVFAPGPESFHAVAPSNGQPPPIPVTPALFEGRDGRSLNGQWNNDPHGRLSFIPTMEQLTERLELDEAN